MMLVAFRRAFSSGAVWKRFPVVTTTTTTRNSLEQSLVIGYRRFLGTTQQLPEKVSISVGDGRNVDVTVVRGSSSSDNVASPAILLLPGALGTVESDFSHQITPLSDAFRHQSLVGVDPYRGDVAGSSHPFFRPSSESENFYTQDAHHAAGVMQELGFSRYSVLGWSDGANAAMLLAARYPKQVASLVVWGGNAYVTKEDVDAWEAIRNVGQWSERVRNDKLSAIAGGSMERLQELNSLMSDAWISMYTKHYGDVCLQELHQIHCPTLVLHGAADRICDEKHANYIARQVANSRLHVFPQGKHNIHQKFATEFNDIVTKFLRGGLENEEEQEEQPNVDAIAYAFMGSKALFSALEGGVFDSIDQDHVTLEEIERSCLVKGERLQTLLSACVTLKLVRRRIEVDGTVRYSLPKASQEQLVRKSKRYWGDYITKQVSGQFYNRMSELDLVLQTGDTSSHGYEAWFESDPQGARQYTQAQHNGSLATAYALIKRLPDVFRQNENGGDDASPPLSLLDVGGGSGAFSIALARKQPRAKAVVLDLPNVVTVAEEYVAGESEGVQQRVSAIALSATEPDKWYKDGLIDYESFDVVLMSYISGSIPAEMLAGLYENAFKALKPGGIAIVHDFFVDNSGTGPKSAALWALAHVTVNPDGMGLRPGRVTQILTEQGFVAPKVDDLIPGATQVITAVKPTK